MIPTNETMGASVCVVGLGYIGLPTALMLAAHGISVVGMDRDERLMARLKAGDVTFREKGLPELFRKAAHNGDIQFSGACPKNSFYIIAVPTPYDPASKKIDAGYVKGALADVLDVCEQDAVIAIESTVSPGTIGRELLPMAARSGKNVHLAHVPERIIPGNMLHELVHNDRIVGSDDPGIGELVKLVYASFCKGEIVLTDIRTAEMSKVVENTFRDVNIAFANELAKICRRGGMDVHEVIRIANKHPRVSILQPGPGVGGHCIAVDPWFLVGDYPDEAQLIRQAREVNTSMPAYVLDRIEAVLAERDIRSMDEVGLYGLTYKEDVDDTRDSPTLQLLEAIRQREMPSPVVFDPMVGKDLAPRQQHDFASFLENCRLVVILVGHSHIKERLDRLEGHAVLDTRHICPWAYQL